MIKPLRIIREPETVNLMYYVNVALNGCYEAIDTKIVTYRGLTCDSDNILLLNPYKKALSPFSNFFQHIPVDYFKVLTREL